MTTRKRIQLGILLTLFLAAAAALAGVMITRGQTAPARLEFWLCVLGLLLYFCRGLWLLRRKRGTFPIGDMMEVNLVCTALYVLILEGWIFPMQRRLTGQMPPEGDSLWLAAGLFSLFVLVGWVLLGARGAESLKTLLTGGIVPIGYLAGGLIWTACGREHPYFFMNASIVGQDGASAWIMGWVVVLPLILLLIAAAEYGISMLKLWYMSIKKPYMRNMNERGTTK